MSDDVRDISTEQFREVGHRLVDWIADYRAGIANLPVMARSAPGDIKRDLPPFPPEAAENFETVIADLERVILPGLTHWQHPRFFGYFPSNATLASALGDYVSTGLGVLGISWQSSPALTELEEVVIDWVRQMIGLSSAWRGVIQDTASTSTLVALLCAREKSSDFSLSGGGLQRRRQPLTVYASDQSHTTACTAFDTVSYSTAPKAQMSLRASASLPYGSRGISGIFLGDKALPPLHPVK
jgi:aromatic-L-amino-acid decarboxylase